MRRLALLLWLSCCALPAPAASAAPVRVILVGDSTMATRTGYGDALCARLRPNITCVNLARGGRSSASFRAEGRWDEVQSLLRDGAFGANYVLVQFGHNDQPGKPGRSTDLVHEFPNNMARYAAEVQALGAIPVLVTPLTRRSFDGPWLHDDLAPWSAQTRRVARASGAALLDLNALSAAAVQAMGSAEADTLAAAPPIPAGAPAAAEPRGTPKSAFDYTHLGAKGAALFSDMVARELVRIRPELAAVPAQVATADGWASLDGGTTGGGAAPPVRVTTPAELRAALAAGAPVIEVAGVIDMQDGRPFADSADQRRRGSIHLASNSTLTGSGSGAGFINANVVVAKARNVVIRHLHFRNPCDVAPVWDPADGPKGNWNSLFDAITVSASNNVWIDHNSFTDAPDGDERAPIENGMIKQCHDGALDINQGSDLVTVSYNRFALHEKNTLVGSGDKATGDAGKLRVSFSNNLFENVAARAPRVRYGKVHLYNNLHVGDRRHPVYGHEYSVGMGKQADVIGDANVYDIAGARGCGDVVRSWNQDSSFTDRGSLLNGAPLAGCPHSSSPAWQVPYPFHALPADQVRAHVLANAGAGGAVITVDDDGPADFRTVQAALNHVMARAGRAEPVTIEIRNGDYQELLHLAGRDNLTIRGESRNGVVIHATNNESLHPKAGRALFLVEDADMLTLDTLTLRNDTERRNSNPAQAETILFNSPRGRLVARNATFISEQDTLQLKGYAWFYDTLVAGNVDFIWGANRAALFERSEIRSIGDSSNPANGGYIVQARTESAADKGFVFINSTLTHGAGPAGNDVPSGRTWLARSPGTATTWDNVSYIDCRMDSHIAAAGWAGSGAAREPAPNPARATSMSGWREAGSTDLQGRPLDLTQRSGALVMDPVAAREQFGSRAAVFSTFDNGKGWNPQP